jgi:predicted acyl esterase
MGGSMRTWILGSVALVGTIAAAAPAAAQVYDERPTQVVQATTGWDYERRVAEIPMRDGVTLHTVILVP